MLWQVRIFQIGLFLPMPLLSPIALGFAILDCRSCFSLDGGELQPRYLIGQFNFFDICNALLAWSKNAKIVLTVRLTAKAVMGRGVGSYQF
jgi:hypothetical protein